MSLEPSELEKCMISDPILSDLLKQGEGINNEAPNLDFSQVEMTRETFESALRGVVTFFKANHQLRQNLVASMWETSNLKAKLGDAENGKEHESKERKKTEIELYKLWDEKRVLKRRLENAKRKCEEREKEKLRLVVALKRRNLKIKQLMELVEVTKAPSDQLYLNMLKNTDAFQEHFRGPRMARMEADILADPIVSAFIETTGDSKSVLKFCRQFLVDAAPPRREVPMMPAANHFSRNFLSTLSEQPPPSFNWTVMPRLRKLVKQEQERQVNLGWIRLREVDRMEQVLRDEDVEEIERMDREEMEQLELGDQSDEEGKPIEPDTQWVNDNFLEHQKEQEMKKEENTEVRVVESEANAPRAMEEMKTFKKRSRGSKRRTHSEVPTFDDCEAAERRLMEKLHRGQ